MVFVVPSVEVHITRIHKQEGEEDEENLNGVLASVHKVSIENIWCPLGWHTILKEYITIKSSGTSHSMSVYLSVKLCEYKCYLVKYK